MSWASAGDMDFSDLDAELAKLPPVAVAIYVLDMRELDCIPVSADEGRGYTGLPVHARASVPMNRADVEYSDGSVVRVKLRPGEP